MLLNSLDLYYLNQCPLRWTKEKPGQPLDDPTRELMRKVFLMKALGREAGWSFSGVASAWDDLFWQGKEVTQDNMRKSVQGVLAARQLYKKLPKGNLEIHSSKNLVVSLDSSIRLTSSGDFLLSYPDRYETWVYLQSTPKRIRRSPLIAIEQYLVDQNIRAAKEKPFYLVVYYSHVKKRRAMHFRRRSNYSKEEARKIVFSLAEMARKKVVYPSMGDHCDKCEIKC